MKPSDARKGFRAGISWGVVSLALVLAESPAVGQDGPANRPLTITVTVSGIRQLSDTSFIVVVLTPTRGESFAKRAKPDFKDCSSKHRECGTATITSDAVAREQTYDLTVCHTRRVVASCPTRRDGRTVDAGEVFRGVDPSRKTQYTVNLEDKY